MIQSPAGYQGDVRIKRYLDFYQAGYGVAMLSSGTTAFTPAFLFASGEIGAWYDPSDLTTMFQDAAGTTPVTAVGQPVGLILDKSGRGNHASQSTSMARPTYQSSGGLSYLDFDGADDFLVTGTINPGSVDKAQVFAGVRKLSDAADRILVDYGPAWATQAGSFGVYAPSYRAGSLPAPKYYTAVKGSTGTRDEEYATYTAPITNVLAIAYDIGAVAASEIVMRINGGVVSPSSAGGDAGGGNFSSLALQVGRYGTSPGTFNGYLYSLILRFSATNMNAATIASTETWVNSKTGAY